MKPTLREKGLEVTEIAGCVAYRLVYMNQGIYTSVVLDSKNVSDATDTEFDIPKGTLSRSKPNMYENLYDYIVPFYE